MAWDLSVPLACFALIVQKQPVVECPQTKTFIGKGKDRILVVVLKWWLCEKTVFWLWH
jgi:hypothetical protein